MKIFINLDSENQKSVQTKEQIIKLAENLKIEIASDEIQRIVPKPIIVP